MNSPDIHGGEGPRYGDSYSDGYGYGYGTVRSRKRRRLT